MVEIYITFERLKVISNILIPRRYRSKHWLTQIMSALLKEGFKSSISIHDVDLTTGAYVYKIWLESEEAAAEFKLRYL